MLVQQLRLLPWGIIALGTSICSHHLHCVCYMHICCSLPQVQKVSSELAEYKAESKAIKNQDLTIRKQVRALHATQVAAWQPSGRQHVFTAASAS
jgi:hypothetical protein